MIGARRSSVVERPASIRVDAGSSPVGEPVEIRCSSVVEHPAMDREDAGSSPVNGSPTVIMRALGSGVGTDIEGGVEIRPGGCGTPWMLTTLSLDELPRHYDAFGLLFGVRDYAGFVPVAPGRGMPADASVELRQLSCGSSSEHDHTWITWTELASIDWTAPAPTVDARIHEYKITSDGLVRVGKRQATDGHGTRSPALRPTLAEPLTRREPSGGTATDYGVSNASGAPTSCGSIRRCATCSPAWSCSRPSTAETTFGWPYGSTADISQRSVGSHFDEPFETRSGTRPRDCRRAGQIASERRLKSPGAS
jgi:hypothetical protein